MPEENETSWEKVSEWYGRLSGKEGPYYHQYIVLPRSLKLLELGKDSSLLDLACGQGVLARQLPAEVYYEGVDVSPSLISQAKGLDKNKRHIYTVADVSRTLPSKKKDFSHAAIVMALQNINEPGNVISNAARHLVKDGKLLIVFNHPCFRIPRQSSWGIDEPKKVEYRRIDRYMTPLHIPVTANPGRGEKSAVIWTYHFPLSYYAGLLFEHGFVIEKLEEWVSDKHSVGRAARMENRARLEFPLFLALLARRDH